MTTIKVSPSSQLLNNVKEFEEYLPEWIDLNNVIPRSQPWLWNNIIPLETSTLLAGYGGIGKSTFLMFLAAHVTNGKSFNFCGEETHLPIGSVILMAAEDGIDTTLLPNLLAVEADIRKIHVINSTIGNISKQRKFLELDKQIHIIESKIIEIEDIKLIIIDPISYFTGETKDHIQTEVANFLQRINDLAKKYKISIILSKHMRKKSGKQTVSSLVDEVGGSAAWVNTPRQSFAFIKHPIDEEMVLMFNMKVNISKQKKEAFNYKIFSQEVVYQGRSFHATKLVWGDKLEHISMNDVGDKDTFNRSKESRAQEIIYNYLKINGVSRIEKLQEACSLEEISTRTCQRAYLSMVRECTIRKSPGNIKTHYELTEDHVNAK